jgi:hypothetical protein
MSSPVFTLNETTYTVDTTPTQTGLWRQNAMTTYEFVTPYMIAAHTLSYGGLVEESILFYHVWCVDAGWIKIPVEIGETILNKEHKEYRIPTKRAIVLTLTSTLITIAFTLRMMKKIRRNR